MNVSLCLNHEFEFDGISTSTGIESASDRKPSIMLYEKLQVTAFVNALTL